MHDPLERKVLSAVKSIGGNPLLVALSGGADSSALLFALHRTQRQLCCPLYAFHVNHSLRGEESDRDELAANDLCKSMCIPFYTVKIDVGAYAENHGVGLEVAGREIRYRELIKKAHELNSVVVTAHTASDNAETILFHLARGTGLDGLCGIPAVIQKDGVTFLRPLLSSSRDDVLAYCGEHQIPFVTDSSNLSDDYTRNRIRSQVIPALKEACGVPLEDAVTRLTTILSEDKLTLDTIALQELERIRFPSEKGSIMLDAEMLFSLPRGISARIVRLAAKSSAGVSLTKAQCDGVLAILQKPSAAASVPSPLFVFTENHRLTFSDSPPEMSPPFEVPLCIGENMLPSGARISLTKRLRVNSLLTNGSVDCNRIIGNLTARSRKQGDNILLDEKSGRKTLKKLLIEKKIPLRKRASVPVICDESGAVIAVCGFGVDSRYKPFDTCENVIIIEFEEQTI